MRLWKSWIVAKHEMSLLKKRKGLLAGVVGLPIVLGIFLPGVLYLMINVKHVPTHNVIDLMGSFGFFFVIIATLLPLYISTNSMVGEKLERSLEPLLATPTTEGEILVGKNISTVLPNLSFIYVGAAIFIVLADAVTYNTLGYSFYPNWTLAIILLAAVPCAVVLSSGFGVFVSSWANSVQSAQMIGVASSIPLYILYVMGEIGFVSLNSTTSLLIIAGCLLAAAVVTIYLSMATFNREGILTKWKGSS